MTTKPEIFTLPDPWMLGTVAIENACCEIAKRTGAYMNSYTLFVNIDQVYLVLRLMANMPRLGLIVDEKLKPSEWMLIGIAPDLRVVGVHSEGL